MAAHWSPKPLVRVRVSGGVPKFRFALSTESWYNYSLNGDSAAMVWQGIVNPPTLVTIGSIPIISTKFCDCGVTVAARDLKSLALCVPVRVRPVVPKSSLS